MPILRLPSAPMGSYLRASSCSPRRSPLSILLFSPIVSRSAAVSFCSVSSETPANFADSVARDESKRVIPTFSFNSVRVYGFPLPTVFSFQGPLKPGLYLVGTPIGNLEDITLRAIRILRSADVILSEDTRHSGKLLQYYNIKAQLLSYHKFNEAHREQGVLKRLKQGEIVALISDAGTPGISDPGTELAKICARENIDVIPIPGACAVVAALSASGLDTHEFTFVGFLPKHSGTRKERLMVSSDETRTQIFYVPPHKLSQFLEDTTPYFGESRQCVIAREITKLHEEFWRGSLGEAKQEFLIRQPKGEITLLIEGKKETEAENPTEDQLEEDLRRLISQGHSLSAAVKTVAEKTSVRRKEVYSLALKKFGKHIQVEHEADE